MKPVTGNAELNKSNSTAGVARVQANREYPLPARFFYNKCTTRECFTFKMNVKVTEYTNHNSRWEISTSIKVKLLSIFSLALIRFPDIHISNIVTLKM